MKKFYMPFVNWFKVGVIWLTDLINVLYEPFKLPPQHIALTYPSALEPLFAADLEARFMQPSGEFFYQLPRPSDAGDTALFQGLCTGYKIMKGADVTNQLNFIKTLFVNGTLIRGYDSTGKPNDTTSNDAATGMLFFFYAALRWGTPDVRTKSGALLRMWVNNLRAHDWALVDLQGNHTEYGALENGIMTDPLRMTSLLGILSIARVFDQSFSQDYTDLYELYRPILAYPKVKLLWWDTAYDTHRAAIHAHVAYYMTKDEVYKEALLRIWRITQKEQNPWVYTLCSIAMDNPDTSVIKNVLGTFSFERRQQGNIQSLNDDQPSVNWPPQLPFGLNVPTKRCQYSLPVYKRGSQEFFWQRNMFSLDEWQGNTVADTYHSGLDFLLCGWLASRLGLFQ